MDKEHNTVTLYAAQRDVVLREIEKTGTCFSKEEYVKSKYGEISPVFLTAYRWFIKEMPKYVPKPEGASFPYWAYGKTRNIDLSGTSKLIRLEVPVQDAVFFNMYDWQKILCMQYMTDDLKAERQFKEELKNQGLTETNVMLTDFYPELKTEITKSWQKLFRYNAQIRSGDFSCVPEVQAGLWQIKKDWIREIYL